MASAWVGYSHRLFDEAVRAIGKFERLGSRGPDGRDAGRGTWGGGHPDRWENLKGKCFCATLNHTDPAPWEPAVHPFPHPEASVIREDHRVAPPTPLPSPQYPVATSFSFVPNRVHAQTVGTCPTVAGLERRNSKSAWPIRKHELSRNIEGPRRRALVIY